MRQRRISGLFLEEISTRPTAAWPGRLQHKGGCGALNADGVHRGFLCEASRTFEPPGGVLQLQRSVVQQLPPSNQVLLSEHLAALHPHDGLAVGATGRSQKAGLRVYAPPTLR